MARQSRVEGLTDTLSWLDTIPEAARDELAVEMGIIGRDISAAQKRDVAKATGELEAGLSLQLLLERLKVRIGLFGRRSRYEARNLFVGRLVEKGRRAQAVMVTRHLKRRLKGNNKSGGSKRRVIYEGKPYKMRVPAMAARPFIAQPALQDAAETHLADYWSKVLNRTGGGA